MAAEVHIPNAEKAVEGAAQCWSCGTSISLDAHFCLQCGKVQRPDGADYFSFFGLRRKLNIDGTALEKEFYRLSRKLHPDLYARATAQEQEWSTEQSSRLNDAYRTLKDPIARTQYLLSLEGVQLEEQSKAATDKARLSGEEKKQGVPPDLLEEVFELNMQLQELRMSGEKDPEIVAQLQAAKQNFENKLNAIGAELKNFWDAWDAMIARLTDDSERIKVRGQMVGLLNRRSYIRNLVRDVNAALDDCGTA